jgi:hypothetical protein
MGPSHSQLTGNYSFPIALKDIGEVHHDIPLWALTVVEYCSWESRGNVSSLSKYWNVHTKTIHYFRFLCQRLSLEHGLYVPNNPPLNENWRTLFFELYKLRNLWRSNESMILSPHDHLQLTTQNDFKERFKISVFAKFRPLEIEYGNDRRAFQSKHKKSTNKSSSVAAVAPAVTIAEKEKGEEKKDEKFVDAQDENRNTCNEITLPLHQRLAMIRMSHSLANNRIALKVLAEEGNWFRDKWSTIAAGQVASSVPSTSESSFTAELQPNKKGKQLNWEAFSFNISAANKSTPGSDDANKMVSKIHSIDSLNGRVIMLTPDSGLREFSYDGVLPPNVSQKYTYDVSMKRLVMDFINGFNGTALVYGQTGSGKTFSMFGRDDKSIYGHDREGKGIIPRVCDEILTAIHRRKEENVIQSHLSISYVEIYGDHITDLLKNGSKCSHSKVSSQRFVLNGAAEQVVHNTKDILDLLAKGEATKRKAVTAMNDRSTRAHSLFILTLKQRSFRNSSVTITSKLFLADLGGSEQVKKSLIDSGIMREGLDNQFSVGFQLGDRMREAIYINLGLLALKRCIEALNNKSRYVPFQDSKLTMLLSEGLGGNSKTSIIICANQHPSHSAETISTLRFGERCSLIENSLRNNATMLQQILDNLEKEIKEVEEMILRKERWEIKENKLIDILAEEGTIEKAMGGAEIKKVAMVVGAEEERKRLSQLLLQKEQLFGKSFITPVEIGKQTKKPVLGFGKEYAEIYDFGAKYDEKVDEIIDNSRFEGKISMEELPEVMKQRRSKKLAWAAGEMIDESNEILEKKAQKVKRNKLAFSGLSF